MKKLWAITFMLLLLCSCSQPNDTPAASDIAGAAVMADLSTPEVTSEPIALPLMSELVFEDVLAMANARHAAVEKPSEERLLTLTKERDPELMQNQKFYYDTPLGESIPVDDAIADTNDLFVFMANLYGGYEFFGGDAVFEPVRQYILERLNNFTVVSGKGFASILYDGLSEKINDRHFSINGNVMLRPVKFYYAEDCAFIKDETSFINMDTGLKATEAEGYELDEIFRLHIDSGGEFIYSPIIQTNDEDPQVIKITYEDGSRKIYRLRSYEKERVWHEPTVTLDRSSGYPVVAVNHMGFDATEAGKGARQFLSYAEELRNEPVLIVDIRGNGGGNGVLPRKWMHMLTGEIIPQNYVSLSTLQFSDEDANNSDNPYYITPEDMALYTTSYLYDKGYVVSGSEPDRFIEREQILIVLTDRFTGSSAENFVDLCFNMENTLIIGTSTSGTLNFDLSFPNPKLPRTGITFGFGTTINLHPEGHLIENAGIQPDIWVAGDALEAAVAMLNRMDD